MQNTHYDWIIVGSGFGGSVSAFRLAEKGYRVLVIEKGRRFAPEDFPRTNWDIRRWYWMPELGLQGIFKMTFLKHATILHGVGVGGGSLVYANTHPTPNQDFFNSPSWSHLSEDWNAELAPHYKSAKRMLGVTKNPHTTLGDRVLKEIAEEMGRPEHFDTTEVAVFFGEAGKKVPDPFFGGEGPDRVGCTQCGACMTGCRVGAKNTLDRNYLYLAERRGVEVVAESEVIAVRELDGGGFKIETRRSLKPRTSQTYTADKVIFAGGVLGTLPLLLKMKKDPHGLPRLSDRLGDDIRTNSEALIGIVSPDKSKDFSKGVAITSILHTDEHSHVEPVRYGSGSGFFRVFALPHAPAPTLAGRLVGTLRSFAKDPITWARALSVSNFAKQSQVLLYMRTLDGTLRLKLGRGLRAALSDGVVSELDDPEKAPKAFIAEATELARRFAKKVGGVPLSILTETLQGVPSTAHILGGCCMGSDTADGTIDSNHRLFGYEGLYVIDGSSVSANPGVNPSLTITALAERAMSLIPSKADAEADTEVDSEADIEVDPEVDSEANAETTAGD